MSETIPTTANSPSENFLRRLRYTRLRDVLRGRIDGQLDWWFLLLEADLPAPIVERITTIVRRRGLWHRERVDVTRELIAHFQDGLDAGATAEELVASFGDPIPTAKLIRRAKRRCRPLWWQAWWGVSRLAATLVVTYVLMAVWLAAVKPSVSVNYIEAMNEGVLDRPVNERAWPLYLRAARRNYELKNEGLDGVSESYVDFSWEPPWDEMSEAEVDTWLAERRGVIELIRQAARMPVLGMQLKAGDQRLGDFDPETGELLSEATTDWRQNDIIATHTGHVQMMRGFARVLRRDALSAARRGESKAVVSDLVAMLGVGRHAGEGGNFLVAGLVRAACERMAISTLQERMNEQPGLFSTRDLASLAHAFAAIQYPADRWLGGERALFLDVLQRAYSDNGHGDGFLTAAGLRYLNGLTTNRSVTPLGAAERQVPYINEAATPALYLAAASRSEVLAKYDRFYALALSDATTPLWQWRHSDGDAEQFLSMEMATDGHEIRYLPIELLAPSTTTACRVFHEALGRRDGVLIGIALDLYRRDQGDWPASLEGLAPRWLPKLPVDPINGGPLGYQLIDGKPVVYSLGVDTDDDGGRLPSDRNEELQKEQGHVTQKRYRVEPPLREPQRSKKLQDKPGHYDGDWVLWSLAEPWYMERNGAGE